MGPNQVDTDRTAQIVLNPFLVAKERFPQNFLVKEAG
jgi:hypothetical protein